MLVYTLLLSVAAPQLPPPKTPPGPASYHKVQVTKQVWKIVYLHHIKVAQASDILGFIYLSFLVIYSNILRQRFNRL